METLADAVATGVVVRHAIVHANCVCMIPAGLLTGAKVLTPVAHGIRKSFVYASGSCENLTTVKDCVATLATPGSTAEVQQLESLLSALSQHVVAA